MPSPVVLDRVARALFVIIVVAVAAACTGAPAAPGAVQPTLDAIGSLGLPCGEGIPDNVPSGLVQWKCRGTIESVRSSVLVEGNEEGVAGITLVVDGSTDPEVARSGFARLVGTVPPLSTAPVLVDAVAGWTGDQRAEVVGGVRVSAMCDEFQCLVTVVPAVDLLRPLPLP